MSPCTKSQYYRNTLTQVQFVAVVVHCSFSSTLQYQQQCRCANWILHSTQICAGAQLLYKYPTSTIKLNFYCSSSGRGNSRSRGCDVESVYVLTILCHPSLYYLCAVFRRTRLFSGELDCDQFVIGSGLPGLFCLFEAIVPGLGV